MSVSYDSGVILGVLLPEICDVKLKSNKFEIHDRKGIPTGKFDYEKSWTVTYKGVTTAMTHYIWILLKKKF